MVFTWVGAVTSGIVTEGEADLAARAAVVEVEGFCAAVVPGADTAVVDVAAEAA